MKKLDFDLKDTSKATGRDLKNAVRVMERHKRVLHASGVVGTWVGAKASQHYIMVAVDPDNGEKLKRTIPDSIEGVAVYYIEGTPAG